MNKKQTLKYAKTLIFAAFIITFSFSAVTPKSYATSVTRMFVNPPAVTANVGQEFTVNIDVENVKGLHVWQFYMYFNSSLLNATLISEGSFSNKGGSLNTYLVPKYYNSLGYIYAVDTVLSSSALDTLTGNGTLATVTFKVLEPQGRTALHINQTQLIDLGTYLEPPKNMPHTEEDGYFALPMSTLSVDPATIKDPSKLAGTSFNVNLTAGNMQNLHSWNITIKWDPNVINLASVTEGAFLNQTGTTSFSSDIHSVDGYAVVNATLLQASTGTSGNGTLATITFDVITFGSSLLSLPNTLLLDSTGNKIIHIKNEGFFANAVPDLTVVSIELSSTQLTVGDSLTITITVKNQGTLNATTFDVTVTAVSSGGTRTVGTIPVDGLGPGAQVTKTITWETKNVDPGDYTIKVVAGPVSDEANIDNNTLTKGTVTVQATQSSGLIYIVAGVVVVVVAGVGILLFMRRRKNSSTPA